MPIVEQHAPQTVLELVLDAVQDSWQELQ